ncbi:MAG: hypothetical protein ACRDA5_03230 [Clostridium sp.]
MKIRIDDEYSDKEGDYNIVGNEYSQNNEELQCQDEFENCIDYKEENNSLFKVEIQYSEEGSYVESFEEKHREYDEFYKSQGLDINNTLDFDNNEQYCNESNNSRRSNVESFSKKSDDSNRFESLANEASENYIKDYKGTYEEFDSKCHIYCEEDYKNECGDILKEDINNTFKEIKGEIRAFVRLDNKNGVEIKGAKVNLYSLNGVCPKLHDSKLTDCNGEVIFSCLENGCYRVISIVDRRYFEKPIYINWNEVTIDNCVKDAKVGIVNKIKQSCYKR